MTIHPIFVRLTELTSISTETKTSLVASFIRQVYSPNQILLGGGQKAGSIYFVEKGLLRSYYLQKSNEITREFFTDNDFLIPGNFFSRGVSSDYVEVMDRSIVHQISYEDLMLVIKDYPELNQGIRELLEYRYERVQQRDQFLRINSAAERYRLFRLQSRFISDRATLPMLSSYLNMSRKHLSRIKNQEIFRK
ncbi:Crp/Fnr family transcriptional regulator [Desertivirga brevis]|uniref:Crp/Fnr family transcriptional regulator n=1 Tax=Desertivirga brevis TaxID=2810310 RepID=UPI001A959D1D|nr:Crp/Fnr family transcriptional regulator [Pedobacter sp. SYSU D00873]